MSTRAQPAPPSTLTQEQREAYAVRRWRIYPAQVTRSLGVFRTCRAAVIGFVGCVRTLVMRRREMGDIATLRASAELQPAAMALLGFLGEVC